MLDEYPTLEENYDLENLADEINEWHAFFFNELLREGKMIGAESMPHDDVEDITESSRFKDEMSVELVEKILPKVMERHEK